MERRERRRLMALRGGPLPSACAAVVAALALAGCDSSLPSASFQGAGPAMRPETFFAGPTTSFGVLESVAGAPTRVFHVHGHGQALADGRFRLDQTIAFAGRPPTSRTWIVRRLDAHRYVASLTDAAGPVTAETWGNLFHLRYPMKSPAGGEMEQWIYLQPDGRTVLNEASVRWFGFLVARLSERISQAPDAAAPPARGNGSPPPG